MDRTLSYLERGWCAKEILRLEKNILRFIEKISKYPKIYPPTRKYKSLRKGPVDKNSYIVYRIKPDKTLEIVNFRGMK